MTVIDSFTERCLKVAARRWPADMRDERYREWTAEMHEIRSDDSTSAGRRAWEQLRYAFSLAASPPAPDENRVPRGWREMAPQAGRWLRPWAVLAGMGVVCSLLAGLRGAVPSLIGVVTGPYTDATGERPVYISVLSTLVLVVATGLAAWLGVVIGRRMPLLSDPGSRAARVVSVVGAPVAVGVGLIAVDGATIVQFVNSGAIFAMTWLYGPLLWMVLFGAIALGAVRLTRNGRSRSGRAVGIIAGLVGLELLAVPLTYAGNSAMPVELLPADDAVLWFPMSLVGDHTAEGYLSSAGVSQLMPVLLVASGFTLWYAIASCRVRVPTQARATRITGPATSVLTVSRPRTGFALTTVAIGLAAWAVGIAYATPAGSRLAELGDSQFTMWAFELRNASMVTISLALGLAMVGRGRPVVTMSVTAIGLLATDTVLDAFNRTGVPGLAGALGFGVVIVAAAWWLGRTLLLAPPGPVMVRRGHIGIAVTAAVFAPFLLAQSTWPETASEGGPEIPTPVMFPVTTTVVTILLVALAGVSAVAARQRRASTLAAMAVIAVPALLFGGCAVISGQSFNVAGTGNMAFFGALLALPYTAWVLATIWWDRVRHPARAGTVWTAIAVASLPASVVIYIGGLMLSMLIAGPLMVFQGSGYPADGSAFLPGLIVLAIGLGVGAAMLMTRPPRPAAPARTETANAPHDIPNGQSPHPVAS